MKVICIDDEYLILGRTINILRQLPQIESAEGFLNSEDALNYLENHSVDAVFLDINMPDITGLELARIIRERWANVELVFLTGYDEFALEAFKVHASGYLIKPIEEGLLLEEIQNIERVLKHKISIKINVVTFGNFELLVDGKMVLFSRSKSKEILAYLVMKNGTGVSRPELASILWENEIYDRGKQKQLDIYIRSLMGTLNEYGIEKIIEMGKGVLRIVPDMIECDYYKYLAGDAKTMSSYAGEFMNAYSWAEYMKDVFSTAEKH